jgi:MFS transporter, AAHS family, 4-hydroxybenzoate transporter
MTVFCTVFYPTRARATGTAWMLGVGRSGAILSAMVGAQMLSVGWPLSRIFAMLLLPAVIAAAAMLALNTWRSSGGSGLRRQDEMTYQTSLTGDSM